MSGSGQLIVATPGRSVCDDHARVLELVKHLRFIALATRHGVRGVPPVHTRLNVRLGLAIYIAAITRSTFHGESFRFAMHPRFDRWVLKMMKPGDSIISSYGYVNECFAYAQKTGGMTLLDGGNSHPASFWEILVEEHRRWKCPVPPVAYHHFERSMQMMENVDFILSPSSFVTNSFLSRGFRPEQILPNIYPVKLTHFYPSALPRPKDRPLTLICTGSLSLRKGTPYLLEAFRIIRKSVSNARLLLTNAIADSAKPIFELSQELPIEWSPPLSHPLLADRLRSADIYIIPSLEEGLVRTALEALACGLPVIVTPNCGVGDHVTDGVNGNVVPIRDPHAIAEAALEWWDRIQSGSFQHGKVLLDQAKFSFAAFAERFLDQLDQIGLMRLPKKRSSSIYSNPNRSLLSFPKARKDARFVVATPSRTPHEIYAVALARRGHLRLQCHGARNRSPDIPPELIRQNLVFGTTGFVTGKFFSRFRGETLWFGMNPVFDTWVRTQLNPGDVAISSYGYLCGCFKWLRKHRGHTILDAGNSHPDQFWALIAEEHKRWGCSLPPISRQQHERGLRSLDNADFVIGVSEHVVDSIVSRGFPAENVALIHRPVNLRVFSPSPIDRPPNRPLTLVSTGSLSLRKGSPYLFEAVDILRRKYPDMRLLLTDALEESVRPLLARFSDLPIEWAPVLPHHLLAARLREADMFVLPSIEEGLARTIMEALSCGLPCIVTPNTGAGNLIDPDTNGDIVPICDSAAIVQAVEKWWERIRSGYRCEVANLHSNLSTEIFEKKFYAFLQKANLCE